MAIIPYRSPSGPIFEPQRSDFLAFYKVGVISYTGANGQIKYACVAARFWPPAFFIFCECGKRK